MQTFLRLSFELNLLRESAIDRETLEALTNRYDEQNEELKRLKEKLGELPGLKEKLAKCAELKERLIKTEEWREKAKKYMKGLAQNLEKPTELSATISHKVSCLVDEHAKLVHENQFLSRHVIKDIEKYNSVLEVARTYKLMFERRARNAKDWLKSDDPEAVDFLGNLTTEMMEASALIIEEQYRLAATELGLDYDVLSKMAKEKRAEAWQNFAPVLDR